MGNPDPGRTRGTPRPCPDRPDPRRRAPPRPAAGTAGGPSPARPAGSARRCSRCWSARPLLYLWNLSASGYANDFYAAAVQAGTQSWKAWLFGSLDSGNAITVDKPPASLWVMTLSARIFGFSSWSLLVPQALMGVASVALLHAAVRRWAGPVAGLLAGAALALTPAAVLMFRFDNPDALLVLLLVAGAYATVRAIDAVIGAARRPGGSSPPARPSASGSSRRWARPCWSCRRSGWPTWSPARPGCARGCCSCSPALGSMIVSAGWFIALVELWPADSRPYIGGSTTNSLLELALGYNGLGRILGGSGNGGGGFGGGNAGFGGEAGILRLFTDELGLEISWLLPAALIALVALVVVAGRRPRTDRLRAAALLWGGWTLVTGLVFSFMSGTMHPYYTVALAPGIAALVGIGSTALWARRESLVARGGLALMVAATAAWSFVLLAGSAESFAWLRWVVVGLAVPAVAGLLVGAGRLRRVALVGVVAALLTGLAGSGAYAVATASVAHTGSIPTVGATSSAMGGGPGGGAPSASGRPAGRRRGHDRRERLHGAASAAGHGRRDGCHHEQRADRPAHRHGRHVVGSRVDLAVAASLELATGTAVMSTGGWGGSDSAVTLEQFQAYVASGADLLLHRRRSGWWPGRRSGRRLGQHEQPDRRVGGRELHRDDGGRPDGLRPAVLIVRPEPALPK